MPVEANAVILALKRGLPLDGLRFDSGFADAAVFISPLLSGGMVAYAVNDELALQEKKHNNLTSGNTRGTPFG